MKRLPIALASLAACVVLVCSLCACSQSSSSKGSEDTSTSYASSSMVSYKGTLYHANFGYVPTGTADIDGTTDLKLETSNFLIYDDTVYYTSNPNGTSGDNPVELHSCGLDGSNDKAIAKDAYPSGKFYIVSGHLVYQHMDPIEYDDTPASSTADSDDSSYSEKDDIEATNESIYWQSLDLSDEKAKPVALNSKKTVQVVAATPDTLYYAKTDATAALGTKLFKASLDLSDETALYKGQFLVDDCAIDSEGNLIVITSDSKNGAVTFDKDGKQLAAFDLGVLEEDTDSSFTASACGLYVTNAKDATVTSFDVATGDKTEHKIAGNPAYYIAVQYADADQVIYTTGIDEKEVDKATEKSSEKAADDTALYIQKWGDSKATSCGTWFES